ncbi:type II toxin-antitoxin system RelE/ParE family toxin (plasmid) [Mesorhizobium sp. AR07]|uniref:type II toxin-antitoxin system RelE/ParE family toxin n=1 Tax=Mesorhizobium sp. AR07 TaxID=2865838 RepID=UPI001608B257|nr:type II toxin-antitoxin system RelE/ParE family toxin [Mesorhizobium sp. AR07]QND69557.1 type II toxin-antitoxin system RelE/ParE family toxin [Mesorhizobium loti]UVK49142.1 type II toxin-antitoxin system RelE/ParE family toxin [Mesorhizobium sp. AR07]
MRLKWSAFALADRDDIFTHIEAESPRAAAAVDEHIAQAVLRLVEFPESGRPGRVPGTRELVISRTPYIAAYVLTHDAIRILRVLHGAQMWPEDFSSD